MDARVTCRFNSALRNDEQFAAVEVASSTGMGIGLLHPSLTCQRPIIAARFLFLGGDWIYIIERGGRRLREAAEQEGDTISDASLNGECNRIVAVASKLPLTGRWEREL